MQPLGEKERAVTGRRHLRPPRIQSRAAHGGGLDPSACMDLCQSSQRLRFSDQLWIRNSARLAGKGPAQAEGPPRLAR
eukprot:2437558-Pyramimonas_sp.AAC.1